MKLGKYFTLQEMQQSETAARLGLDNTPDDDSLEELKKLVTFILDPLRMRLDLPVIITSGYRSPVLNLYIPNSSKTSQHMTGQAADIFVPGMTIEELFQYILFSRLPFDQLIEEGTWVHVSYKERPRHQAMRASFSQLGVRYVSVDAVRPEP